MKTQELDLIKKNLVNWVDSTHDLELLTVLESMRRSTAVKGADWWDELNSVEIANIEHGLKDVENGNVLSSKEFWERLK